MTTFVYSEQILSSLQQARSLVEKILVSEMKLPVFDNTFFFQGRTFIFSLVAFEDPRRLGFFSSEFHEIGLNKALLFSKNNEQIKAVLRHELAHYMTWILHGALVSDHGQAFRAVCKSYGWGKEVSSASVELSEDLIILQRDSACSRMLSKIEKLLALSSSANVNESEQATLKANALLLKHNLEEDDLNQEEESCVKRVLHSARYSAKMGAISTILRTFLVSPVLNRREERTYLEVFGKRSNVLIAEYVATYLERELDVLWKEARRKDKRLKGLASKNSFFRGVGFGYLEKVESLKKQYSAPQRHALTKLEENLDFSLGLAYPRLRNKRSHVRHDEQAAQAGVLEGKQLNIRKPVSDSSKSGALLT